MKYSSYRAITGVIPYFEVTAVRLLLRCAVGSRNLGRTRLVFPFPTFGFT